MEDPAIACDVSVIIPAYGRAEELDRCLHHLARQDTGSPPDMLRFQVVVVDDGSPDSLEPCSRAHESTLSLRFHRHPSNRGRAAARNSGAALARGDVLLFLDADMLASPRLVRAHHEAHRAARGEALVGLGPIPVAPEYQSLLGKYMETRGHMRPGLEETDVPYRYFVSSNTSVARARFEEVGGYDECFIYYGGEDIDLGYRLHRAGARVTVVREAVSHHAYRYHLGGAAARMREFGGRTLPLLFERHPELRPVFHVDLLGERGPITATLFRLLTSPPLLAAARAMAPLFGAQPGWLLSYVLVGNTLRGYLDRAR